MHWCTHTKSHRSRRIYPFFLLLLSLAGCQEATFETGCSFAPPTSKWPAVDCTTCNWSCINCFMNISFMDQAYAFSAEQINREPGCDLDGNECMRLREYYSTPLFQNWQVVPESLDQLQQWTGLKMPLQSFDVFDPLDPTPTSSLRLLNYCEDRFEIAPGQNLEESYNLIDQFVKSDSGRYLVNDIPFDWWQVDYHGTLRATFLINGQPEPLTAEYQLRILIEKEVD